MLGSLALLILGRLGGQERRSKRRGREVGSETAEVVRGALKLYCHTGLCCSAAGLMLEEGPPPFLMSLVSMMMTIRGWGPTGSAVAGGLPQQPLEVDGILMDGEEAGKAQSH